MAYGFVGATKKVLNYNKKRVDAKRATKEAIERNL